MILRLAIIFNVLSTLYSFGQIKVHVRAHAHNDYENDRPLFDALQNGFLSVEADVHLYKWNPYYSSLLVGHDGVDSASRSFEQLYLKPLDSLVKSNKGPVYKGDIHTFYLMIDIKTEADTTYLALKQLMSYYPKLKCSSIECPVKIFLSGNRPMNLVMKKYEGLALDGRPADLGQGFSNNVMPVISDSYWNWCKWDGKQRLDPTDLQKIRELAQIVHGEDKKLRLWASPDNPSAWKALLDAGVDLINTDKLQDLNEFLKALGK